MTAPSMAEVLAKHQPTCTEYAHDPPTTFYCRPCSEAAGEWVTWTPKHVAWALAAAGFGHVASVEARAAETLGEAHSWMLRAEAAEAKVAAARAEGAAEALDALRERLVAAERQLRELAPTFWESVERERVSGKAQGMQLALSYADEMTRLREQVGE